MKNKIVDSHCHLNYEPLSVSLKDTINRANKEGIKYHLGEKEDDKNDLRKFKHTYNGVVTDYNYWVPQLITKIIIRNFSNKAYLITKLR